MSKSKLLLGHNIENKLRTSDVQIQDDVDFNSMLLSQPILDSLEKNGFKKPSPIQLKAIPMGRFGYDLIVKSKSGTGKTAVFSIIALEMIDVQDPNIQVLMIAPTREIAVQIETVIKTIGECIEGLNVCYFIGGTPLEQDIKKLKKCHIAVGAPGRLKSLIKSGKLKTSSIRLFVLDEADKLLESSFQNDINYIYNKLPGRKQIIAASATYPQETQEFLSNYMKTPTIITPNSDVPVLVGIRQYVSVVKPHLNVVQQMSIKTTELIRILQTIEYNQCVIFSNYQNRAETLSNQLNGLGWPCVHFSGAQNQKQRLEAIACLKEFKCRILSTTDLTARGIDAANLDLVINYEVPGDSDTYLHRMGRAGRYGSTGVCVTLAAEGAEVVKLQQLLGKIGGSVCRAVYKIPFEGLTTTFWTQNQNDNEIFEVTDNTEQICTNLEELSVMDNATKDSVENILKSTQKSEKDKNDSNLSEVGHILHKVKKNDVSEKSEIKNKLGNLSANKIIEMLSHGNKIEKSKCKKIKSELSTHESNKEIKNIMFENEADLFQKNNIAKKNIALYNITKLVVEQKSVTKDNISCMKTLLESLKNENKPSNITTNPKEYLEKMTGVTIDKNDPQINDKNQEFLDSLPQWVTVREYELTETGHEVCLCHQNILTNCYSYALGKSDLHWKDTLCKIHPYEEDTLPQEEIVTITKDEFLNDCDDDDDNYEDEEEYYGEEYEEGESYKEEYYEEQIPENNITWDEDLLVNAYDYALHSEVTCGEVAYNDSSNDEDNAEAICGYGATQTYPHLTQQKSRKRNLEYVDSSNDNSVVDHQNTYESYFEYCNESLSENALYFYDVESFEQFFDEWQNNVREVREYVHRDIYHKELNKMS